jgi:hypothetical protein
MQIFTSSPQKRWFGGKLKFLNVNLYRVTHHFKGLEKEEECCKLEVSTIILRKVMAVQSSNFFDSLFL